MQFSTGLSAIRAHQTALNVAGHNIANASTPGYHRQEVLFKENPSIDLGGHLIGTGVSVDRIRRAKNAAAEDALMRVVAEGAGVTLQLSLARQIESMFLPGNGNVFERVESFFNDLQSLSSKPDDSVLRTIVLNSGARLTEEFNRVVARLDELSSNIEQDVVNTVKAIETKSAQIAAISRDIGIRQSRGAAPNVLLDQRELLVQELAELIDVETRTRPDGREEYVLGGVFLLDSKPVELNVLKNEFGELEVWKAGCVKPVVIGGGKLGGLLSAFNELGGIADLRAKLDEFAKSFMAEFDTAHAFGVGIDGSFDRLRSSRPVSDTSVPLSQADTVLPVQAGNLFISVTDNATGDSTLSQINIDPATQSLADIAAAISTVGNLNAVVDSAGGMTITAQAGYSFDFTGNLQTRPDPALITGDTEPQIFGAYEGTTNDDFTFTFLGSGTVGVDAGLQVEVRNSSGVVVRVLDVGKTYEPGSRLQVGDGVQLALSSGVANLGDSFQSQVISQPDETGFLAALGINTLFTGGGAADMRINPLLDEDPNRLATTTIGDPNDTRNLLRMMQLRESRELANGTQTYEQYLAAIIASVGQEVRDLTLASENSIEFRQLLETEINTISGVDINEELVRMLEFQRGFQAAARYIAVLDEALQDLFDMIR